MGTVIIVVVVVALVAVLAAVAAKRKPEPPTQQPWTVPQQLDRADFARPDAPWLVALFTSNSCHSCASVTAKAEVLASDMVAVDALPYQTHRDVHTRYGIDAVPTTLLADAEGVVRNHFIGPVTATDLWAAMAELREPGSTPPPEAHGPRTS
jgi:hypothetical protein